MLGVLGRDLLWPFSYLLRHRTLTWELTKREVTDRYVGQVFGVLWAIGHPVILVLVYVVVFKHIFKVRFGTDEGTLDYTVFLLSGLLPWMAFQEAMTKGTQALVVNANLVKQVIFPIEILPVKTVLASFLTQSIGSLLLCIYLLATTFSLPPTIVLLPALWLFQCLAMTGVAFMLSAVGAYFRDMKDIVQVFGVIGMYLAPIAYVPQWMPPVLQPIVYMNPFSYMIWCYQDVCFLGHLEHGWAFPIFAAGSLLTFLIGFRFFQKVKVYLGNAL